MNCILISPKIILSKHKTINHVVEDNWFKYLKKKKSKTLTCECKKFSEKGFSRTKT